MRRSAEKDKKSVLFSEKSFLSRLLAGSNIVRRYSGANATIRAVMLVTEHCLPAKACGWGIDRRNDGQIKWASLDDQIGNSELLSAIALDSCPDPCILLLFLHDTDGQDANFLERDCSLPR